ncbi:MAG: hypothetical protein LBK26_03670 [Rickettsiales bacterium]|nr:hypothetical protein [Rickettsiales bacterium]
MKNISIIFAGALGLAACTNTYYKGGVSYAQDNQDCRYEFSQYGDFSARQFDEDKYIVYKNALCSHVFANDMGTRAMPLPARVVAPVVQTVPLYVQRNYYTEPVRTVRYNPVIANANRYYTAREIEITVE